MAPVPRRARCGSSPTSPIPTHFSAAYDLQGSGWDRGGFGYVAEGYANLPINDRVAVRLVGWDEHDPGYLANVPGTNAAAGIIDGVRTYQYATQFSEAAGGGPITISNAGHTRNDYNSVDTYGARMALQIDLNDNWTITPTLMGQETRSGGVFAYDPTVGFLKITHFLPEYSNDRWYQAALTIQGKVANLDLTYAGAYMDRMITAKSDYSDYSFFYDKAYGSYGYYVFHDDAGHVIDPSQAIWSLDHFTKMSHEIRRGLRRKTTACVSLRALHIRLQRHDRHRLRHPVNDIRNAQDPRSALLGDFHRAAGPGKYDPDDIRFHSL